MVDASGSIQDQPDDTRDPANWLQLLAFVKLITSDISKKVSDARFAEVVFSDRVRLHFGLTSDVDAASSSIDSTPYFGSTTNIADGLSEAVAELRRVPGTGRSRIIILITDGKPNVNEDKTLSSAAVARQEANVIAIGITDAIDRNELLEVVGGRQERLLEVMDFQSLSSSLIPLLEDVCPTSSKNDFL